MNCSLKLGPAEREVNQVQHGLSLVWRGHFLKMMDQVRSHFLSIFRAWLHPTPGRDTPDRRSPSSPGTCRWCRSLLRRTESRSAERHLGELLLGSFTGICCKIFFLQDAKVQMNLKKIQMLKYIVGTTNSSRFLFLKILISWCGCSS